MLNFFENNLQISKPKISVNQSKVVVNTISKFTLSHFLDGVFLFITLLSHAE